MANAKTFRLFISSTFSDFQSEREVLQSEVFPYIKKYALSLGYTFQPIDLRWGVNEEAQLDQKTLDLCLNEVKTCKSYPHPNFLVMLGDRYGWIPLPYTISKEKFELLISLDHDTAELEEWYQLDLNQLPASYILKKRSGDFINYKIWEKTEESLRKKLHSLVHISDLSSSDKEKYFISATEAEVYEGIFENEGSHVFGFFRNIKFTKENVSTYKDKYFKNAQKFKSSVKKRLTEENKLELTADQIEDTLIDKYYLEKDSSLTRIQLKEEISDFYIFLEGLNDVKQSKFSKIKGELYSSLDEETFDKFEKKFKKLKKIIYSVKNLELLQKYQDIEEMYQYGSSIFSFHIKNFLKKQIDEQKEKDDLKEDCVVPEVELEEENLFLKNISYNFIDTEETDRVLNKIYDYVHGDDNNILVLHGPTGVGKSAVMAKAIETIKDETSLKVVYRFAGVNATIEESSFLGSLDKFKDTFTLFIDGVNELSLFDLFQWLPTQLPSNVKVILSTNERNELAKYINIQNEIKLLNFTKGLELLLELLKIDNRTIQEDQKTYFLEQFTKVKTPLYSVIAKEEIKNWRSSDLDYSLASTSENIILEFIDNLSSVHHHDSLFVQKILGYMYASKRGVSETTLLELISMDKDFINKIVSEIWHKNSNQELPLIHWSRLYTQLKPFLGLKIIDKQEYIYFMQNDFYKVLEKLSFVKSEHYEMLKYAREKSINMQYEDKEKWRELYLMLVEEKALRYEHKTTAEALVDVRVAQDELLEMAAKELDETIFSFKFIGTLFLSSISTSLMFATIGIVIKYLFDFEYTFLEAFYVSFISVNILSFSILGVSKLFLKKKFF